MMPTMESMNEHRVSRSLCLWLPWLKIRKQNAWTSLKKVMKADYIDPCTVTLRKSEHSVEYKKQKDNSYRSSIFCLLILWIFVLLSELIQIPNHLAQIQSNKSIKFGLTMTLSTTCIFISFLGMQLFLMVAHYSQHLPIKIRDISEKFSGKDIYGR